MYPDAPVPQNQPTDTVMTALYHQLDDHELGDDTSFDVYAGLQQLADRIRREGASSAPIVPASAAIRPRHLLPRLRAARARRRRPQHRMTARGRYRRPHPAAVAIGGTVIVAALIVALSPQTHPGTDPTAVRLPLRPEQTQISTEDKAILAVKISTIRETSATRIEVTSYAGGPGTSTGLAHQRAESVVAFLKEVLKEKGISPSRIEVQTVSVQGTNNADAVVVTWSNPPTPASPPASPATPVSATPAAPTPTPSLSSSSAPTTAPTVSASSSAPTTLVPTPSAPASAPTTPAPTTSASPAPASPTPAASPTGVTSANRWVRRAEA